MTSFLVELGDEIILEVFYKAFNLSFFLRTTYAGKNNVKAIVVCKRSELRYQFPFEYVCRSLSEASIDYLRHVVK